MKAELKFYYDLPEDKESFDVTIKAQNYKSSIDEMFEYLRQRIKYENLTTEQYDLLDVVRNKFAEILQENEV